MSINKPLTFTAKEFTPRLDCFLAEELEGTSRAKARSLCQKGHVTINGKRCKAGNIVSEGDVVEVKQGLSEARLCPELVSEDLAIGTAIEIIYEDDAILVVNKPREIHSVRQTASDNLTLADIVSAYLPNAEQIGKSPLEAGLVQRLDFFTSGLVVVAKSKNVWEILHRALTCGAVKKKYLALVEDIPPWLEKKIELSLSPGPGRKTMLPGGSGKEVTTDVKVSDIKPRFKDATFVVASSQHTIRHQIRAHLCAVGHCLVGDELYGSQKNLVDYLPSCESGFFLHAQSISFLHPTENKQVELTASSFAL